MFPAPSPSFSVAPQGTCVGGEFTFTNTSPGISGSQWDFGDGTTSTLTSPTHSYTASGVFPVTLTVTSALNGCTATIAQFVNVSITPVAAFTPMPDTVSYTHLRAHETVLDLVCRLLLEKKNKHNHPNIN